jgi:hypothetical protein
MPSIMAWAELLKVAHAKGIRIISYGTHAENIARQSLEARLDRKAAYNGPFSHFVGGDHSVRAFLQNRQEIEQSMASSILRHRVRGKNPTYVISYGFSTPHLEKILVHEGARVRVEYNHLSKPGAMRQLMMVEQVHRRKLERGAEKNNTGKRENSRSPLLNPPHQRTLKRQSAGSIRRILRRLK